MAPRKVCTRMVAPFHVKHRATAADMREAARGSARLGCGRGPRATGRSCALLETVVCEAWVYGVSTKRKSNLGAMAGAGFPHPGVGVAVAAVEVSAGGPLGSGNGCPAPGNGDGALVGRAAIGQAADRSAGRRSVRRLIGNGGTTFCASGAGGGRRAAHRKPYSGVSAASGPREGAEAPRCRRRMFHVKRSVTRSTCSCPPKVVGRCFT